MFQFVDIFPLFFYLLQLLFLITKSIGDGQKTCRDVEIFLHFIPQSVKKILTDVYTYQYMYVSVFICKALALEAGPIQTDFCGPLSKDRSMDAVDGQSSGKAEISLLKTVHPLGFCAAIRRSIEIGRDRARKTFHTSICSKFLTDLNRFKVLL